jgi:quercetin dioxygenase-like cupin family protein
MDARPPAITALLRPRRDIMEHKSKSPTVKGPSDWFTGDVWIDTIAQGHGPTPMTVGAVHFTPGARTAWHVHSIGQTLYVTEGEGRVQSRGGPIVTICPGDVVYTSGDEWHWHGASPDHLMTHISVAEGGTEWGEHVADDEHRGRGELT